MMPDESLDLFDYHDYRIYLRERLELMRETRGLSLREIAHHCGLASGYLPMVLSEKRNLSKKALLKLQAFLALNSEELNYFKKLLVLSDSEVADERLSAFSEIKKLRSFRKKSKKEIEVHAYLSSWLNVTIREMAFRADFIADAAWIRPRLLTKVAKAEVERSLQFLIKNGFLKKESGRVRPSGKQLDCFGGVYKLSLGEFHKQMFHKAIESIDVVSREQRNLLGHTFVLAENQIPALRAILDETLKKVEALKATRIEAGPVYHVSLATFPLAKKG